MEDPTFGPCTEIVIGVATEWYAVLLQEVSAREN
jgi:hypothetical protein